MAKIRKKIVDFPNNIPTPGSVFLYARKNPNGSYTTSNYTYEQLVTLLNGVLTGGGTVIEVTHSQLLTLIGTSGLTRGSYYLITDYQTVYDQPDYDVAGIPKVGVVTKFGTTEPLLTIATSTNTISSQVYSLLYPKDKILYDVSQTTTPYMSNSNMKGKIYERIDDRNNRTGYDHRAVLFKRYETALGNGIYTSYKDTGFGSIELTTFENSEYVRDNYISNDFNSDGRFVYDNVFDVPNSVFGYNRTGTLYVYNNTIGGEFVNNTTGDNFFNNTIGNYCVQNVMADYFAQNTVRDYFVNNNVAYGFYANNIGDEFINNTVAVNCSDNFILNYSYNNTIGANFQYNRIGANFSYNNIDMNFQKNDIQNFFETNTVGTAFQYNRLGNYFNNKTLGANVQNLIVEDKLHILPVSSADILSMGTSPIVLLAAPGANKYYDNVKITIEYDYGTVAYNNAGGNYIIIYDGTYVLHNAMNLNGITDNLVSIWNGYSATNKVNSPLYLTTAGGGNPTTGNGTIRVIITYSIKTFGTL